MVQQASPGEPLELPAQLLLEARRDWQVCAVQRTLLQARAIPLPAEARLGPTSSYSMRQVHTGVAGAFALGNQLCVWGWLTGRRKSLCCSCIRQEVRCDSLRGFREEAL